MAEYYSAELAQKIRRGMKLNAEKCKYTSGPKVFGYSINENLNYEINQTESVWVKNFEYYSIKKSINFDLRFIYLMDNFKPTHVTISKFLNNLVVKFQQEIFISITKTIIDKYNICIDDVFLDGTKLEANANKFKSVWKPTTFKKNLYLKIRNLLLSYFHLSDNKKGR